MTTGDKTSDVPPSTSSEVALPAVITTNFSSFGHPLSTVLTIKLDEKNYPFWRGMVLAILRGQKLDGFILGTKKQPNEFISQVGERGVSKSIVNPNFEEWKATDQALLGWLFGSMTPTVACEVVDIETSQEVWSALEELFGAASRARIIQLRNVLQTTRKGAMRMLEYLTFMKQTSESLKLAGEPTRLNKSRQQNQGPNRGRNNERGRGRGRHGNYRNNSKPTCQLCGKYGHAAAICYKRFNREFSGLYTGASSSNAQEDVNGSAAYVATPKVVAYPTWLADSGASNHITTDLGNLNVKTEYNGQGNQEGVAARNP